MNHLAMNMLPLELRTQLANLGLEIVNSLIEREILCRKALKQEIANPFHSHELRIDAAEALTEAYKNFDRISFILANTDNI